MNTFIKSNQNYSYVQYLDKFNLDFTTYWFFHQIDEKIFLALVPP